MYIIFDTETTGLIPKDGSNNYYSYKNTKKYDNTRMIQISYEILDENLNIVVARNFYINEVDVISNSMFHNITVDIIQKDGIKMNNFASIFETDLKCCSVIIAHNLQFDYCIIMSELYRFEFNDIIDKINSMKMLCSMKRTKHFVCKNRKYPKLLELYNYANSLDLKELPNAHNSMYDVSYLRMALIKLKTDNVFDIFMCD
jgi:DNA polymerase-3 subunit epsilon|tara:strand:+ start:1450 stop:2052 length:603 start_codon:yes stop_codon:yes gene_type:complete